SGAAYVFLRNGTTWSHQAYLKASNTGMFDGFGTSVAITGETVVVGANGEDSNATGVGGNEADNSANSSGAAYVFVRNGKPSVIRREIPAPFVYLPLRTHFTSPEELYGFHFPAGPARSQNPCRSLAHHPSLHS
ncbi:MAG: FG-GAP repeat protein, partial [Acidobacteriota bacterium]